MDLYHSPSCILLIPPCLFLSLSAVCHALQLKTNKKQTKKTPIIRLHLTSPLLTLVFVLLWMIRVLKASVQVITFFILFVFVFLYGCLCGNTAFFIASNTTSSTLHFFYFDVCICLPLMTFMGRYCRGGYRQRIVWGQGECGGHVTAQGEVLLANRRL